MARDEKLRALRVIGVEDVNRKLDVEVNVALEPIDQHLSDLRSTLDAQIQRNNRLKVIAKRMRLLHAVIIGFSRIRPANLNGSG